MDYYKLLDCTSESTDQEIRSAYKKLALKWHPDKNKEEKAKEMFQKLQEAYNSHSII